MKFILIAIGDAIGIFLYISLDFFGFQNSFCYICNVKEYI